jgi:hypothetical protein
VDAKGRVTSVSNVAVSIPSGALTFTGDVTGSGSTGSSTALTLANSGVTAGTYTKVTVDAKGRVTTGATLASADLPTYTGSLTSAQVTGALGFTPYNSTNPSGYITNTGNARVGVENNGTLVGTRRNINFIPGTGVSLTITDDSANEEVDVTVTNTGVTSVSGTGTVSGLTLSGTVTTTGSLTLGGAITGFLPSTGGTLTGELSIATGAATGLRINSSTGTQSLWVRAGYDSDGSATPAVSATNVQFQSSGSSSGTFSFVAGNTRALAISTGAVNSLVALQQGGNQVVHAGNVSTYALPIGGGTVTGTLLTTPGGQAMQSMPDGYIGFVDPNHSVGWGVSQGIGARTGDVIWALGSNGSTGNNDTLYLGIGSIANSTFATAVSFTQNRFATFQNGLNVASGALQQGGNQVLHASNYSSYALPLSGGVMTGHITWGGYTDTVNGSGWYGLGRTSTDIYSAGGTQVQLAGYYGLRLRTASAILDMYMGSAYFNATFNAATLQNNGNQVLHAGNYTSYSPSLTGSGASGTWGISISGNAATASRVTSGNLTPASTSFNNALIPASGSNRVLTFDGNGSLPSVWWSNGTRAYGAIDAQDPGLTFWANNGSNWQRQITLNYGSVNIETVLQQGGNQVLHAGNYTNYLNYGNPSSRGVYQISNWNQTTYPNAHFLSSESSVSNAPTTDFTYGIQTAFHRDGASYRAQMVTSLYSDTSIWVRNSRDGDAWTGWKLLLHSGNYTNYSPTLTGSGASGTWGINITGSHPGTHTGELTAPNFIIGGQGRSSLNAIGGNIGSTAPSWNNSQLEIKNTDNGTVAIAFHRAGYTSNTLDVRDTSGIRIDGSIALHAANFSSYALPLGGGSLTGNLSILAQSASWAEGLRIRVPTRSTWGGIRFTRDEGNYNGNWAIGFTGIDSTDDLTFWGNSGGSDGMRARLTQAGNFTATGNVTAYSDERLKKDWASLPENFVERLAEVKNGTYTRTDEDMRQVGVSAQSLQPLLPEAVLEGEHLSVAYGNAALAACVELAKELVKLKQEILELKAQKNV